MACRECKHYEYWTYDLEHYCNKSKRHLGERESEMGIASWCELEELEEKKNKLLVFDDMAWWA